MALSLSRNLPGPRIFFLRRFLDLISKSVSSSRPAHRWSMRAEAVKIGRRTNLAACFALARPYLDGFEHDGTLNAVAMTIRGEPKDPNHDAVMRIGSEAPKRRTHSSIRRESQGASRDSATSNRHRRPVTSVRTSRNCRGAFSVLRSLCRTQNNAIRDNALPHEPPQGDQ